MKFMPTRYQFERDGTLVLEGYHLQGVMEGWCGQDSDGEVSKQVRVWSRAESGGGSESGVITHVMPSPFLKTVYN